MDRQRRVRGAEIALVHIAAFGRGAVIRLREDKGLSVQGAAVQPQAAAFRAGQDIEP